MSRLLKHVHEEKEGQEDENFEEFSLSPLKYSPASNLTLDEEGIIIKEIARSLEESNCLQVCQVKKMASDLYQQRTVTVRSSISTGGGVFFSDIVLYWMLKPVPVLKRIEPKFLLKKSINTIETCFPYSHIYLTMVK